MKKIFLLSALSAIILSSYVTVGNNIKTTRRNHKKTATAPMEIAYYATRNNIVASQQDVRSLPAIVSASSQECLSSWLDQPVSSGSSQKRSYYYAESGPANVPTNVPNKTFMIFCNDRE
jgi:hypothetical protein